MKEYDLRWLQEHERVRNFIAEPEVEHRKLKHDKDMIFLDRQYVREKLRELVKFLRGDGIPRQPDEGGDFVG